MGLLMYFFNFINIQGLDFFSIVGFAFEHDKLQFQTEYHQLKNDNNVSTVFSRITVKLSEEFGRIIIMIKKINMES